MKKLIILYIIIWANSTLNAQTNGFQDVFLGKDFLIYKGAYLQVKPNAILGFQHTFYNNLKYCQDKFDPKVAYPGRPPSETIKDSLVNKTFLVTDIIDKTGKSYEPNAALAEPIFILKDTVRGQILYYKYDTRFGANFPFYTSEIKYPADFFCNLLSRKVDDFTNEISISTPYADFAGLNFITLHKNIDGDKILYFLLLNAPGGKSLVVDGKGIILLFEDGSKLSKPDVKVDVEAGTYGYKYSAAVILSKEEVNTLAAKKIKKFRLYIFDKEVKELSAKNFVTYVQCVINAK